MLTENEALPNPISPRRCLPLAVSCLLADVAAQAPAPAPKLQALLVAVQDYPERRDEADKRDLPARLRGPRNDVERVRRLLRRNFGFADGDIAVLSDAQATHEGIVRALGGLAARCDADTCALFWYSGHGSLVPDVSGLERERSFADGDAPRSYDGSLVCYDSRNDEKHNRDLVDDELHSLVRQIARRARHLTVVTDSCYSGGATRGGGAGNARFQPGSVLPWDRAFVSGFWPAGVELLDDDAPQRKVDEREGLRYAHIAACGDAEEAREHELVPGRHFGALSYFLTSALDGPRAPGSWREVAQRARASVAAAYPQTVWFEGELDSPVFGGVFRPAPPGFPASGSRSGQVLVDAGRLHGIGEATEVALFGLDDAEVGRAKARKVLAGSSAFEFDGVRPPGFEQLALVARVVGAPGGRAPLRIRLGELVPPETLRGSPFAIAADDGADGAIERVGARSFLRDPEGYLARELPEEAAARQQELFREHGYRLLREFIGARGKRQVELQLASTPPATARALGLPVAKASAQKDGRTVVEAPAMAADSGGALVSFVVRNPGAEPAYVVLLSVCEDRSVNVLWPEDGLRDNVLGPGKSKTIEVVVGPNAKWRLARPMVDRYVAIATPRHADFRAFCSAATLQDLAAGRGDADAGLPPALELALHGGTTRGESATARLRDREAAIDFGVAYVDLLLVAAK